MEISPDQIRAARAMLRLGQDELARRAGISAVTVRRAETGSAGVSPGALDGLRRALEAAGVEFTERGVQRRAAVRPDAEERYRAIKAIAEQSVPGRTYDPDFSEADLYGEDRLPA
jgi:transcriptional regulator with XRE-family HTH domain